MNLINKIIRFKVIIVIVFVIIVDFDIVFVMEILSDRKVLVENIV